MEALETTLKTYSPPADMLRKPSVRSKKSAEMTIDKLERNEPDYPFELIDGKVVRKMCSPIHGKLAFRCSHLIGNYLEITPIGEVFVNINYRILPDNLRESRAPDVSFIRADRLPEDLTKYPTIPPDLAVEIISTHDNFDKVIDKAALYIQCGVIEVWIVIPRTKEILIYTKEGVSGARDILRSNVLPGLELKVKELFR